MSIVIKNINKSFADDKVLSNLCMQLENGEVYCIMGASGMGKTTFLRILMGHEEMDSGTIEGIKRDKISSMFQEDRLIMGLSAIDNVAIVSHGKSDKKQIKNNLLEILPEECLDKPVSMLSGGMKRRVALARAMAYPGELIILDEPFTGLDRNTKLTIINYILKMQDERTILIATHGLEDAGMLGAKIIMLDECQTFDKQNFDDSCEEESFNRDDVLSQMKMFDGIEREKYVDVIEKLGGYEREYKKNEIIWNQAEKQEYIGVVLSGSVQAADVSRDEPQIIGRFSEGNSFGEAVAFGKTYSWVQVNALQYARILFISARKIVENKSDNDVDTIAKNILCEMASKFAMLNMKNRILSEPRLRNRILMYLGSLVKNADGSVTVPFKQKELAQYLNVNRTSFNRELARMKEEGLININGYKVYFLIPLEKLIEAKKDF